MSKDDTTITIEGSDGQSATMNVYVVFGDTGEYSDSHQWAVCAYLHEEKAKARVVELENLMKACGVAWLENMMEACGVAWDERRQAIKAMREHERGDPDFDMQYTGTRYHYEAIELKDGYRDRKDPRP